MKIILYNIYLHRRPVNSLGSYWVSVDTIVHNDIDVFIKERVNDHLIVILAISKFRWLIQFQIELGGVFVANVLYCDTVVSEFELQLRYLG